MLLGLANQRQAFTSFPQLVKFWFTFLLYVIETSCALAIVWEMKLSDVTK